MRSHLLGLLARRRGEIFLPFAGSSLIVTMALTGCSVTDDTLYPSDAGDGAREVASDAPPDAPLPAQLTLMTAASDSARLTIDLGAFALHVTDATGDAIFDSPSSVPAITGDTANAYGPLGATAHATEFTTTLVEGWDHVIGTDGPWLHATQVVAATSTATTASIDLVDPTSSTATFHVDLSIVDAPSPLDGSEIHIDATVTNAAPIDPDTAYNQMGLTFATGGDEHFFGLGERLVTVDHRGQHYECWVEEGGIGAGEGVPPGPGNPSPNGIGMTHAPIPFFMSTNGYGLWQDTSFRTGFALASDDPAWSRIYAEEPALHLRLLIHPTAAASLAHFTALTGRAHAPAPWVFGPRRRYDHGTMVNGIDESLALRQQHVPTTMIDDTTHFLPSNSANGREGFLATWTSQMHALGYKAIGYFNAYVSLTDPNAADLVTEGRARNDFVRSNDGTEFDTFMISGGGQTVATIDMTDPDAVTWYQSQLQGALDLGYDGWMLDFGEYLPQAAAMFDGRTGWEMHDAFPPAYQQATYDYLRQVRGDDFMFYARAGYTGSQATIPVLWSGDPAASFDEAKGLPAQLRSGINAGLSGIPFWGSDISGYTCANQPIPDKEVYLRWAEFGALSSDMHDENACSGAAAGSPPKWTLWSDAETTTVYGSYALLHTRLEPYVYSAAKEAESTGLPVIRHPLLMVPNEPNAFAVTEEYFFGPALYVAPVVHRGDVTRALWLPPGGFFDWWTLAYQDGGAHGANITVDAPLDTLPMFQRAGTIIAMLDPSIETLAPETNPDVVGPTDVTGELDLRVALDGTADSTSTVLTDGTDLYALLGAGDATTLTLPSSISPVLVEESLATCSDCGLIEQVGGGGVRVRVTTSLTSDETVVVGPLVLKASEPTVPTRFRWDVVVMPHS